MERDNERAEEEGSGNESGSNDNSDDGDSSESSVDAGPDESLAVNKPIDRNNLKTQA